MRILLVKTLETSVTPRRSNTYTIMKHPFGYQLLKFLYVTSLIIKIGFEFVLLKIMLKIRARKYTFF